MRWITAGLIILIMVTGLLAPTGTAQASTPPSLFEYYNEDDNADVELYTSNWFAQTFTTGDDGIELYSLRLRLLGEGTPGNLYVSIRETTAGAPSGLDLSAGAIAGALLTTDADGLWYEIVMTSVDLEPNTTYAIVCYGTGTSAANNIHWRYHDAGTYAGGQYFASTNGGVTWAATAANDFMFEVWGVSVLSIDSVRIFESYDVDGDWLIAIRYRNNDPVALSAGLSPEEAWTFQLLDDTDTVVATQPVYQWGLRPGRLYLSSAMADALEWGNIGYTIRMQSLDTAGYYVDYSLVPSSWSGSTLSLLDSWCIASARLMAVEDSATYITSTSSYGDVLSHPDGGSIFIRGIPGLDRIRPELFYVSLTSVGSWDDDPMGDGIYSGELDDWQTAIGPELTTAFDNAGDLVGLGGRWVGGALVFASFLVLAGLGVATGHFTAGLSLSSVVLIGGVLIGLIPMGALFVAISLLVVMFVKNFWWQGA